MRAMKKDPKKSATKRGGDIKVLMKDGKVLIKDGKVLVTRKKQRPGADGR
jgi:hypothetical protein